MSATDCTVIQQQLRDFALYHIYQPMLEVGQWVPVCTPWYTALTLTFNFLVYHDIFLHFCHRRC